MLTWSHKRKQRDPGTTYSFQTLLLSESLWKEVYTVWRWDELCAVILNSSVLRLTFAPLLSFLSNPTKGSWTALFLIFKPGFSKGKGRFFFFNVRRKLNSLWLNVLYGRLIIFTCNRCIKAIYICPYNFKVTLKVKSVVVNEIRKILSREGE